ncbi:MAG: Crp/Fnr family transcriptional regulator [Vampirovibrionales bacterium]|nr:Crp/Fnr family transcriptional regulator [Vampirovibrionales bacterium]
MPIQQFYDAGQLLIAEGEVGDRAFEVVSGEVLIFKQGDEKTRVPLRKIQPGGIFGESFLLAEGKIRSASALALSRCEVRVYPEHELRQLLLESPPLVRTMVLTLVDQLRHTTQALVVARMM